MDKKDLGLWAKEKLSQIVTETDTRLGEYWNEEVSLNFGYNASQRELIKKMLLHGKEHNLRKAKRLRGSFVYFGYKLGNKVVDERVWKAAESVELVHTALLMHDDFMDRDVVRRGGPTTHKFFENGDLHYGESMAVCLGDALLCLGFERLLDSGFDTKVLAGAMKQLLRGIANTAYGQAYDSSLPKQPDVSEDHVMSLHRAKTAIYTYENPLIIGAKLAELSEEVQTVLKDYSVDGGIAFQLQDDVLGIYGDEEKTGKSANSDLLQGKVTLLIVKTLESGTEDQKEAVKRVWGSLEAKEEDVEKAKQAIKDSGAYSYSVKVAKGYAEKAANTAMSLRDKGLDVEAIDYLEGIARYMVEREV